MPDVDRAVRQTLRAWRTEMVTYVKRWLIFTVVLFPVFTAYIWWLVPSLELSVIGTLAAVLSLMVAYVMSYLSVLGERRVGGAGVNQAEHFPAHRRVQTRSERVARDVMDGECGAVGSRPGLFLGPHLVVRDDLVTGGHNRPGTPVVLFDSSIRKAHRLLGFAIATPQDRRRIEIHIRRGSGLELLPEANEEIRARTSEPENALPVVTDTEHPRVRTRIREFSHQIELDLVEDSVGSIL